MRTKHLFVLIHIKNKGKVGTIKLVKAPLQLKYFTGRSQGGASFCGYFSLFTFRVCHADLTAHYSLVVTA